MPQHSTNLAEADRQSEHRKPPSTAYEFLTDAQLGVLLKVDVRTTLRWRTDGGGPPFIRRGRVFRS